VPLAGMRKPEMFKCSKIM